jgi:hypothetical protein
MKRNATIEQVLVRIENNAIKRIIEFPLRGYFIIITGVLLFVIYTFSEDTKYNFICPFLIIAGVFLVMWGSIDTFLPHIYYKDTRTGELIRFSEVFFDKTEHLKLVEILESGHIEEINQLHKSNGNLGIKLKLAINSDKSVCLVQVQKFVEYNFAITSKVKQLTKQQAELLIALVFQTADMVEKNANLV